MLGGPTPADTGDADLGHSVPDEKARNGLCRASDATLATLVPPKIESEGAQHVLLADERNAELALIDGEAKTDATTPIFHIAKCDRT